MQYPFKKEFPITQNFGENPKAYAKFNLIAHNGIDFGCPTGTEVLAPIDGTVAESSFDRYGYGNYLKITNEKEGCILAHLAGFVVKVGDTVKAGDVIGLSNNTGNSTGPHLHFGYYKEPRDRGNGYNGYIDPLPFMDVKGGEHDIFVTPLATEVRVLPDVKLAVREKPARDARKSGSIDIYYSDGPIKVIGYTKGEEVDGNVFWWKSRRGNYFWSGGTDRVPESEIEDILPTGESDNKEKIMTQAEKDAKVAELEASVTSAKEALAQLEVELEEAKVVKTDEEVAEEAKQVRIAELKAALKELGVE